MEEEKEGRLCVVKDKKYDFYRRGKADYVNEVTDAILNYNDIPDEVKEDSKLEILFLDSKEGLENLAKEGAEILIKEHSSVQQ